MLPFYHLAIYAFGIAIRIASLFNPKARLFISGRKNIWQKLEGLPAKNVVWFHAASLGEFEQGRPVMEHLKQKYPEIQLVVTFFSPSGYEIRKDYHLATVLYLPIDTPINAKKFVKLLKPKMAVFIRYEFWVNYLDALQRAKIPTVAIAAQFRSKQFMFSFLGKFIRKRIAQFAHISVQYPSAQKVLLAHGFDPTKISVCGDSRFDRALETVAVSQKIPELETFCGESSVIILGSCYTKEVAFVLPLLKVHPQWKFILAPHLVDDDYVRKLEEMLPEKAIRFTNFKAYQGERILMLNTIGQLASAYRYGKIAVVGGGFRDGIHNIIEPAAFGLPVFFGSKHHKFPEAQEMINNQVGFEINEPNQLRIQQFMQEDDALNQVSARMKKFVEDKRGAVYCIANILERLISKERNV